MIRTRLDSTEKADRDAPGERGSPTQSPVTNESIRRLNIHLACYHKQALGSGSGRHGVSH